MAYVPHHLADVFISYCHEDDCAWIERLQQDLYAVLTRKLRARTKPTFFFDTKDLRAGRSFDSEIAETLAKTGFFLAIVSPKYNSSTYCRHKELAEFLRRHPVESGRLIQIHLDPSAALPVPNVNAVSFNNGRRPLRPDGDDYQDALRKVYEPIACELDKLYAESKMVFLAWPGDPELEEERKRLELELEGRGLRTFPEAVAEYEGDVRLRDALQQSMTSVHLFGDHPSPFDLHQWEVAVGMERPCILASRSATEAHRGPAGSPAPIYLAQGNPTIAIAKAVEQIANIGKRDERDGRLSLGRTPVFLVFKPDADATLGIKLRKRIPGQGPFEVVLPTRDDSRYEALERAKGALLCRAKAGKDWLASELDALNTAMAMASSPLDLRRALLLPEGEDAAGLDVLDDDKILDSDGGLDDFLKELRNAAA